MARVDIVLNLASPTQPRHLGPDLIAPPPLSPANNQHHGACIWERATLLWHMQTSLGRAGAHAVGINIIVDRGV